VLSQLTGDDRYFKIAKRAMKHALDRRSKIGLMAANIDARTGEFTSRNASIDVYADSFYEYLWDAWALFGDEDCKRWASSASPPSWPTRPSATTAACGSRWSISRPAR
jgi:mannosyl-oligosaccharide alpha-1,2-mannosidase